MILEAITPETIQRERMKRIARDRRRKIEERMAEPLMAGQGDIGQMDMFKEPGLFNRPA